jgi:hypothetical protein
MPYGRFIGSKALPIRLFTMGMLRESAYKNKPNILLSTGAYLYRRGA